jgi:hypothetical protein
VTVTLAFGIGRDEWRDTTIVADVAAIRIDVVALPKKQPLESKAPC